MSRLIFFFHSEGKINSRLGKWRKTATGKCKQENIHYFYLFLLVNISEEPDRFTDQRMQQEEIGQSRTTQP